MPKLRRGNDFPEFLEPRRAAETALAAVIREAGVRGVSTRAVDELVNAFGMTGLRRSEFSRLCSELDERVHPFLDRLTDGDWPYSGSTAPTSRPARPGTSAVMAVMFAITVNTQGQRRVLGLKDGPSEAARRRWRQIVDPLRENFPTLAELMDSAEPDVLASRDFPKALRPQIHSTNPPERLNAQIKRRTDVVGIVPDHAGIVQIVAAMLIEQNDERSLKRRSMQLDGLPMLGDAARTRLPAVAC